MVRLDFLLTRTGLISLPLLKAMRDKSAGADKRMQTRVEFRLARAQLPARSRASARNALSGTPSSRLREESCDADDDRARHSALATESRPSGAGVIQQSADAFRAPVSRAARRRRAAGSRAQDACAPPPPDPLGRRTEARGPPPRGPESRPGSAIGRPQMAPR